MVKNILIALIRYLILILAVFTSLAGIIVLWIQYTTISATTLPMELDKYAMYKLFPGYHLLPLIGVLTGLLYSYLFLKLKIRSKQTWWITLASLTIIPINHISLAQILTRSVQNGEIAEKFSWTRTVTELININYQVFISLFSSISIISICIIFLILTYSRFSEQNKQLPKKGQYVLLAYSLILMLPITGLTVYGFFQSYTVSDDYEKIQHQVNFKLYKATYLPDGLKLRTKYFINNSKGVNVLYEFNELKDAYTHRPYKAGRVVISQSKADSNRTLENALKSKANDDQASEIQLHIAKDKKAVFFTNPQTNDRLIFITNDEVWIQILGNHIDHAEYTKMAESLK
jgi:hypothetical protein